MSQSLDPRIDAYIAQSAEFAQPILKHLRALVHEACPSVSETLKWGMPFFEHAGRNLCHMAAFKAHCAFGFWHQGMRRVVEQHGEKREGAMGYFGRITRRADLPADATLRRFVQEAAKLNESGAPARIRTAPVRSKKAAPVPTDLAAGLKKNRAAARTFAEFSPSHRNEYVAWITEAKRDATGGKRIATTLAWLAEGKARNWKYAQG